MGCKPADKIRECTSPGSVQARNICKLRIVQAVPKNALRVRILHVIKHSIHLWLAGAKFRVTMGSNAGLPMLEILENISQDTSKAAKTGGLLHPRSRSKKRRLEAPSY